MPITPLKAVVGGIVALLSLAFVAPGAAMAAPGEPAGVARVAAVFPLTTPETRTALIGADALAGYTAPTGALTRDLDAVIDTPAAIGIDPLILASIRVLGTDAPQSALDWLDRLSGATNETFALSYADSDITLGLQAGSPTVLAPTSFDFAIDPAKFAAAPTESESDAGTETESPSPTSTETPGDSPPVLPTTESLLAWDYTVSTIAWPLAGTVVGTDLATIAASGYTTTILGSGNVDRADSSKAMAMVGDVTTVSTDDGLSALFTKTATTLGAADWTTNLTELQFALDAHAATGDTEGATVVLAIDRSSLLTAARLGATLSNIDALPSSNVVPFASVLDTAPGTATLVDQPQTEARLAAARTLLATEASDASFATVAANPELITGERRLRALTTMSTAWNSYPGGWSSALTLYAAESETLHNSVRVVRSSEITLFADRASLYITVSNELGQPVNVNINVVAPTPLLEIEQSPVTVTIEPESQKRGAIPVQSLSNGTAIVSISISSTVGVPIGGPTTVGINVYAGWETPITVALAVFVVGVFGFGIARLIVRRRRARKQLAAGDVVEEAAE
jgi:hypothetical protein